jgi:hypothetical protein
VALSNSRRLSDPYPRLIPPAPLSIVGSAKGPKEDVKVDTKSVEDGVLKIEHPDGSVTIDFNTDRIKDDAPEDKGFGRNLAKEMQDSELDSLATNLLEGIMRDEESRKEWIETRTLGISLLGLKLEKPRSDAGSSSAPLEGMSTIRHPLLLEATVSFQATARAELLPASGPVKVRNDSTTPPPNIQDPPQEEIAATDELANALEKDMNFYLTGIATEYVPDTDRMLFYVGFGGDGFKKVYNCPLRRRPVSESIDAEDLIISNAATDIKNCGRVTHRIHMRQSILRRMQILGAYRDIDLGLPGTPNPTTLDKKKEEVAGVRSTNMRPEDRDYEVYETYCELDLDDYAPKEFKGKGLPLPYRVTIEKESRKILDIRRNWEEDDDQCLSKQYFVQFPLIRGLGFYGLGYIHLLGNTTNTLTAVWREMVDAGMFANFPGFLYAKGAGRQNTNQFRVPPGGGVGLDIGAQQNIRDAIMPLPYKEVGQSFSAFATHVEDVGRRLASTANIQVGEGKQDAPVGTTLALIEQASKVMDSAHKRLHAAQAEEFKLLKERFKEDPEAFWRHNRRPTVEWKKEQFIEALNKYELVPVADPNNPTSLHRIAKAMAIKTLQQASPQLYNAMNVDRRIMRIVDIDPEGLFNETPTPPPPDPRMVAIQAKAQTEGQQNQIQLQETQLKAQTQQQSIADKAADRASREKVEQAKIELQKIKLQQESIIHAHDAQRDAAMAQHQMGLKQAETVHGMHMDAASKAQELLHQHAQNQQDIQTSAAQQAHELQGGRIESADNIRNARAEHDAEMARAREEHETKMQHIREMHQAKLEQARALAKVQKSAKPAKKDK